MRCPSCSAPLSAGSPECPGCGLTLRQLDVQYGALPRHSYLLTDHSGRLRPAEVRELNRQLRLFHRKFPQSVFSVFLLNGVPARTIAEYAFWIANRARFGNLDAVGSENFNLLLGIDAAGHAATLLAGYALEQYLTEHDLERALAGATPAFYAGDFRTGIRTCVELMSHRMRNIVRRIEGVPEETSNTEHRTPNIE